MADNFTDDLSNVIRLDQPLSASKRSLPTQVRWQQRRALETSINNRSLLNISSSVSKVPTTPSRGTKRLNDSLGRTPKTQRKTPSKSPGRHEFTPNGSRKTPCKGDGCDRFIPSRSNLDFDTARFLLQKGDLVDSSASSTMSPSKLQFQRQMSENLCGTDLERCKVISYRQKAPVANDAHSNGLRVLYSQSHSPAFRGGSVRHIPQAPDRILDAPDIVNDYYLNLLDWSCNNHLAVSLGPCIYLWNAASGEIQQLLELEAPEDYVCSVKWLKEGNILAVGNLHGEIALWDVEQMKKVRSMTGHTDRVGALSWNEFILSSGSRSGKIHHSDVRIASHLVSTLNGHSQEVCGLAWSPDKKYLASGGNDNVLNVWESVGASRLVNANSLYTFTQHQAAVKAVAWCPWQPSVLASGGGTADRCIRLWNCSNGSLLNTVDTKSQVCSLLWAPEYKELVSAHGYANNEVAIWKYPSMTKTAELLGHTERILHLSMSPDGTTVVSAGADETLRLWRCFAPDPNKVKACSKGPSKARSALKGHIR